MDKRNPCLPSKHNFIYKLSKKILVAICVVRDADATFLDLFKQGK